MWHKFSIRGVRKRLSSKLAQPPAINYQQQLCYLYLEALVQKMRLFSSMPSSVISKKLKHELLNRDKGEPHLGAAKRSNCRLKMNFSANKSVIAPSAVQHWHWPPLQSRPMESTKWKHGILTRVRPSSVQHTDIFQTKATESHKNLSFLTA